VKTEGILDTAEALQEIVSVCAFTSMHALIPRGANLTAFSELESQNAKRAVTTG
jgi:hypothetical protein